MKIRDGFVSNSSSTCFLIRLDSASRDLAERNWEIANATEVGLDRSTSICYGEDLIKYARLLVDDDFYSDLGIKIFSAIDQYGLNNVLFLRESDEGMGGYLPPELASLTRKAFYEYEFH